ncbi:MAG: dNTP triphosphohydrolase [Lutibacter sp.]|jgi:dGTPase
MTWDKLLSTVRIRDFFIAPSPGQDHRTEFQRDYDRAIFSTPVRRLIDKAQVFPLEANDSIRTRMTHSLEVSTVARDMARTIGLWLLKKKELKTPESVMDLEAISATCGLIHDLGNPPFGHSGEFAIRDWFAQKGKSFFHFNKYSGSKKQLKKDFLNFEGNAQTLRLVSKLQVLSDLYGLNFTCGTMSALCKYTVPSHKTSDRIKEHSKVGYFSSEELLISLIRNETGTGKIRNPISFIIEAADDIVYSIVDIEDSIKKGVMNWAYAREKLEEYSSTNNYLLKKCFLKAEELVSKQGSVTLYGRDRDEAMVQAFRIYAIGMSVTAAITAFKQNYSRIMIGQYHNALYKDSKVASLISACKDVGLRYIYCTSENLKLEVMGKHIIHDLMDVFWQGLSSSKSSNSKFAKKIYKLISPNYRQVFECSKEKPSILKQYRKGNIVKCLGLLPLPKDYYCMQLLTDYICGMTDTFACTLHKRLMNG